MVQTAVFFAFRRVPSPDRKCGVLLKNTELEMIRVVLIAITIGVTAVSSTEVTLTLRQNCNGAGGLSCFLFEQQCTKCFNSVDWPVGCFRGRVSGCPSALDVVTNATACTIIVGPVTMIYGIDLVCPDPLPNPLSPNFGFCSGAASCVRVTSAAGDIAPSLSFLFVVVGLLSAILQF